MAEGLHASRVHNRLPPLHCILVFGRLAVDLANLIISWELQRCTSTTAAIVSFRPEGTSGEQCASGSKLQKLPQDAAMLTEELGVVASTTAHAAAGMTVRSEDEFKASAAIVEVLVNFLIRVALVAGDSKDAQGLGDQCVILLDQARAQQGRGTNPFASDPFGL